jgi:pimeloyl-ACP methyl ester carboxylesterase
MIRFLMIAAIAAALAYAGACWYLHAKQRQLIYYGWTTTADAADTDFVLQRSDATLRGWVVNRDRPDPILYFGGNAERIEANRGDFARLFPERSVYLVAYRGYGASTGEPGEASLVPDALAVFDQVQRQHPGQRIAVIGRSLGSGIASQVAAQRQVERLALITPFDSMVGAAKAHYPIVPVDWLLNERYESAKALHAFRKPILIVHGGRDEVVPETCTQRLIAALPALPKTVRIATADHNDISNHPEFDAALSAFMAR